MSSPPPTPTPDSHVGLHGEHGDNKVSNEIFKNKEKKTK